MNTRSTTQRIYGAPLALAALTVIGLAAALLGDGFWDGVSWITLAAPIAVTAWYIRVRKRGLDRGLSRARPVSPGDR